MLIVYGRSSRGLRVFYIVYLLLASLRGRWGTSRVPADTRRIMWAPFSRYPFFGGYLGCRSIEYKILIIEFQILRFVTITQSEILNTEIFDYRYLSANGTNQLVPKAVRHYMSLNYTPKEFDIA